MRKLFLALSVLALGVCAQAQPLFNEYKTKVLDVTNTQISIADSSDIVIGASAVIKHTFDEKATSIIARADVVQKDGSRAILKVSKFEMIAQGSFPDTGIKPTVGDDVIVNYLYDRALIIVPNQDVFKDVTKQYSDITWIHPDLVAAYLTKLYRPNPDKKLFQQACYQNASSLIFFGVQSKGYFMDCNNFNVLKIIDIRTGGETQKPFYARINNIESSWFSWDSKEMKDYHSYYQTLLFQK